MLKDHIMDLAIAIVDATKNEGQEEFADDVGVVVAKILDFGSTDVESLMMGISIAKRYPADKQTIIKAKAALT